MHTGLMTTQTPEIEMINHTNIFINFHYRNINPDVNRLGRAIIQVGKAWS